MAAVTPTSLAFGTMGSKNMVTAVFGSVSDNDTWASPLRLIEGYTIAIEEAVAAAADSFVVSSNVNGTLTFDIASGPITASRITIWGY